MTSLNFPYEIWSKITAYLAITDVPLYAPNYPEAYRRSRSHLSSIRLVCRFVGEVAKETLFSTVYVSTHRQFERLVNSITIDERRIFRNTGIAQCILELDVNLHSSSQAWTENILSSLNRILPFCTKLRQLRYSAPWPLKVDFLSPLESLVIPDRREQEWSVMLDDNENLSVFKCDQNKLETFRKSRMAISAPERTRDGSIILKRTSPMTIQLFINIPAARIATEEADPIRLVHAALFKLPVSIRVSITSYRMDIRLVSPEALLGNPMLKRVVFRGLSPHPTKRRADWTNLEIAILSLLRRSNFPSLERITIKARNVNETERGLFNKWESENSHNMLVAIDLEEDDDTVL